MDSVGCVAAVFIVLGLVLVLAPQQVAKLGVRLDSTNQVSARETLKRYQGLTRWTGWIVGGVFIITGLIILLAGHP